jgi:hypothetical protein
LSENSLPGLTVKPTKFYNQATSHIKYHDN